MSSSTKFRVWDVKKGREEQVFDQHGCAVFSVTFDPNGKRILSGGIDGSICLWYADSGRLIRRFNGHTGCVNGLSFSANGDRALSGAIDRTMRLWDVETGKEIRQFEGHTSWINSVALSPNGHRALSGSGGNFIDGTVVEEDDNSVCLWDVETGELIERFSGHNRRVSSVAFSPDERYVVSASWDGTVRFWRLPD